MIDKIGSFGVQKVSFGKVKYSKDEKTKQAMEKLQAADHLALAALNNVDKESERRGYDVFVRAQNLKDGSICLQADAYAQVHIGSYATILENIAEGRKDSKVYSENKDKLTPLAYDLAVESEKTLEAVNEAARKTREKIREF